jgi:two-component system, OmpR family, response regulator
MANDPQITGILFNIPRPRVLIVDDNDAVGAVISRSLEAGGYATAQAATGAEALRRLRESPPDLILLDLSLPDADGLSLISPIRAMTRAPIIIVSGRDALVDRVVGLEMGADDYLGKPFEARELLARVKAGLRRCAAPEEPKEAAPPRLRLCGILLDAAQFQAFDPAGRSCGLTPMEFRLLAALAGAPNCVLSREQLLDRARQDSLEVFDRAVDIQVMRIRRKIGDDPKSPHIIRTVRGIGYALACPVERLVS